MKFKVNRQLISVLIPIILLACGQGVDRKTENLSPGVHKVIAREVLQSTSYTYVKVSSGGPEYWIAIRKAEVQLGRTYYWSIGNEMKEFTSKELQRTFASIYFVQDFTDHSTIGAEPQVTGGRQPVTEKTGISVVKAENGITLAELFSRKDFYAGKKVRIRGEVIKFLPEIMEKNWIHLQDGTRHGEYYDLTITTPDSAGVGSIVTAEGIVSVNRDFGSGYFYEVILEDARLK